MSEKDLDDTVKVNESPVDYNDRAHFSTSAKDVPEVQEVEHVERVTFFVLCLTACVCLSGFLFGRLQPSLCAIMVTWRTRKLLIK
jgi:hypothetical protein